jgi:hypothetical protein
VVTTERKSATKLEQQLAKLKEEAEIGIQQREDAIKRRDEIIKRHKVDSKKAQDTISEL